MSASIGSGAHKKGNSRERLVAKQLTKWSGERVMRTLSSGAGGTRAVDEIRMTGDLFFPLGSNNSFSYEIKDHATTKLNQVFNNNGDIPEFWKQAVTDCRRVEKYGFIPMLIFHISRETDYVLTIFNPNIAHSLLAKGLKCQIQVTSYKDDRLKTQENFLTILTTLPDLMKINFTTVCEYTKDFDWEHYAFNSVLDSETVEDVFTGLDSILKKDNEGNLDNGF